MVSKCPHTKPIVAVLISTTFYHNQYLVSNWYKVFMEQNFFAQDQSLGFRLEMSALVISVYLYIVAQLCQSPRILLVLPWEKKQL